MTRAESFTLTTAELKEALCDYISKVTDVTYHIEDMDGFAVSTTRDDAREYTTFVSFKEKV